MTSTEADPTVAPPQPRQVAIFEWFTEHPGYHRCTDVADAMNAERDLSVQEEITTHHVAVFAYKAWKAGRLARHHIETEGRTRPLTVYGMASTAEKQKATKRKRKST
jgi:hypothetical protein